MELSIIDKQEERIAFSALEVGDLFVRWDMSHLRCSLDKQT